MLGYNDGQAYAEITGLSKDGNTNYGTLKYRVKETVTAPDGEPEEHWVTKKDARKQLKALGAIKFKTRNIWNFIPVQ